METHIPALLNAPPIIGKLTKLVSPSIKSWRALSTTCKDSTK